MKKIELLKNLGLSEQEIKVYLSLIERGASLVSNIARDTKLHRPTIYQSLTKLSNKGLITVSPKGNQKLYSAESPEKLAFIFDSLKEDLELLLPELNQIYEKKNLRAVKKRGRIFHPNHHNRQIILMLTH